MSCRIAWSVAALGLLVAIMTGCGLKGSLEMPQRSTNVVIRGPQPPAGGAGTVPPGEAAPPPQAPEPRTEPAEPSATKPPADDRMPPPPLPGGNPGSAHGG